MPCPTCKGRCCVNKHGNPSEHGAALALHSCPDCRDGTYEVCGDPEPFIPQRTAEDERADVLAWLRRPTDPVDEVLTLRWARGIERGEHVGAAKNKSSDDV